MNRIYLELLQNYGIPTDACDDNEWVNMETEKVQKPKNKCCTAYNIIKSNRSECYSCIECGNCSAESIIVNNPSSYPDNNKPYGSASVYTYTRKRYYQPLTHFKEHLRRYMGARFINLPENITTLMSDIDAKDPEAYYLVRSRLKELKLVKLYKEIFVIIYAIGGINPRLEIKVYEECIREFKILMHHFMLTRTGWKRHSMPSMYMLMDILLKKNGHVSHYHIPYLKDQVLRDQVFSMYDNISTTLYKIKDDNDS